MHEHSGLGSAVACMRVGVGPGCMAQGVMRPLSCSGNDRTMKYGRHAASDFKQKWATNCKGKQQWTSVAQGKLQPVQGYHAAYPCLCRDTMSALQSVPDEA